MPAQKKSLLYLECWSSCTTEPLSVHRPSSLQKACLLFSLAVAQVLLLLLQPMPAQAAEPCPASMAPIPGGTYRIGAAAQLPEEQPGRRLRISPFCLDRTEVSNDRFAAFVAATGYVTVAERPLTVEQFPELKASERAPAAIWQGVANTRWCRCLTQTPRPSPAGPVGRCPAKPGGNSRPAEV
jgi:formylglycine-generating enzyme required for sulfatase activity